MRAIVLAAGQGTRLRPLTDTMPKCLVELCGVSLLERQADVLRRAGVDDIVVVGGYRAGMIEARGFTVVRNERYETTNMVASLFAAEVCLRGDDDVLIAYGDIVYEPRVLDAVLACDAATALAVDLEWRRYWSLRFDDPLRDAETLKIDRRGCIVELGKKPAGYEEIEAQYMGLILVRRERAAELKAVHDAMDRRARYDGKDYDNMFMTSFLQHLVDVGWPIRAVPVRGGWLEVDSTDDLALYHALHERGELAAYWNPEA